LIEEGRILFVYIGIKPYYILNTPEAIKATIHQHINDNSYTDEKTGCKVWTAHIDDTRGPTMRQTLIDKDAGVNVRRWLFSELIGRELTTKENIKMKARCIDGCINPEHMVKKKQGHAQKGKPKALTARLAMSQAMKRRWGKPEDAIETIRSSEESSTELAKRLNMSRSNVWSIRTHRTYKLQQNPFSGLGAR